MISDGSQTHTRKVHTHTPGNNTPDSHKPEEPRAGLGPEYRHQTGAPSTVVPATSQPCQAALKEDWVRRLPAAPTITDRHEP